MSANPITAASRRERRTQRFGTGNACVRCGVSEPRVLVPIRRRLLEAHHACGRAHDNELTVPVCRNCHALLTEAQLAAGVQLEPPPTLLHQVAAALASLFSLLHELSERGLDWVRGLEALANDLDSTYPDWRDLPSAAPIGAWTK